MRSIVHGMEGKQIKHEAFWINVTSWNRTEAIFKQPGARIWNTVVSLNPSTRACIICRKHDEHAREFAGKHMKVATKFAGNVQVVMNMMKIYEDLHPFSRKIQKVPEITNEHIIVKIIHHTSWIHNYFIKKYQIMHGSKKRKIINQT